MIGLGVPDFSSYHHRAYYPHTKFGFTQFVLKKKPGNMVRHKHLREKHNSISTDWLKDFLLLIIVQSFSVGKLENNNNSSNKLLPAFLFPFSLFGTPAAPRPWCASRCSALVRAVSAWTLDISVLWISRCCA